MKREERSLQFETLARENGWHFSPIGTIPQLEKFEFQTGEKRKIERIENLIEGDEFKVFDVYWKNDFKASDAFGPFAYKNMTAQNARQQTFVLFESPNLNLPKFHIYPANSRNFIDSWLDKTFRQTSFPDYPEFQKKWIVLGGTKKIFSENVVAFYKQSEPFWTFGRDNFLFIYQPDILASSSQISLWIKQISTLAKLLEQNNL